jgi:hypothetical protein
MKLENVREKFISDLIKSCKTRQWLVDMSIECQPPSLGGSHDKLSEEKENLLNDIMNTPRNRVIVV